MVFNIIILIHTYSISTYTHLLIILLLSIIYQLFKGVQNYFTLLTKLHRPMLLLPSNILLYFYYILYYLLYYKLLLLFLLLIRHTICPI